MNKKWILLLVAVLLALPGCASRATWEEEELHETSHRLLADGVEAEWTVQEQEPSASDSKHPARIRISLKTADGTSIERFDLNHEKLLHLIVVSKDLSYFNHIHPAYVGNGAFEIDNDFPFGGAYRLIADFKPTGGDAMTKMAWVNLRGEAKETGPVVPGGTLVDIADGVRAKLTVDRLAAKSDSTLSFELLDDGTGEPITDLEPYLGAIGHVVVLSEDGNRYVHVHAEDGQGTGPKATFEAMFPSAGVYKIWGQFGRGGRVFTVSYVVDVPREEAAK